VINDKRHPVPGAWISTYLIRRIVKRSLGAVEDAGDNQGERSNEVIPTVEGLTADLARQIG
jgi:hypothetical protein